MNIEGNPSVE